MAGTVSVADPESESEADSDSDSEPDSETVAGSVAAVGARG